jgi:hypothetical protein
VQRTILVLAITALFILTPNLGHGAAQSVPEIDSLQISFWPEFDRQSVLVIYRIMLAADTPLPAIVSVPIPAEVEEPHAVAVAGPDGSLLLTPYEVTLEEGRATVTLESDSLEAQVEFYMDLEIVEANRSYAFEWPGGVAVGSLTYEVQWPLSASELTITPPPQGYQMGNYGLLYFQSDLGPQQATSTLTIDISYRKTVSALTVEQLQPTSALDRPQEIEGSTSDLMPLLPWILFGFSVVLLVAGGIYILWLRNQLISKGSGERRRSKRRRKAAEAVSGDAIFCHNCGRGADGGDLFCRQCGERLRRQ